jgi:hypothetical protein
VNLASLMTRQLEVTTPGDPLTDDDGPLVDDRGRPTFAEPSTVTVLGYLEQTGTSEITVGQQTAPSTWWAALPAGTPVKATSTLRAVDTDQRFEVTGEPAPKWNPWDQRTEFVRIELAAITAT